tara:strand:- start:89 stop:661 length:573 start_codon:yes stop_codon:yes gene_type:complete
MQQNRGATLTERVILISPQRLFVLLGLAGFLCVAAIMSLDGTMQRASTAAGMSLGVVAVLLLILRAGHRIALKQSQKALALFITNDSAPSFITRSDGEIFSANAAAEKAFGTTKGTTLASALVDRIGNPGPMLFRLQSRAAASGSAREEIVTNSDQILLSIHALDNNNFDWRIEPQNTQASGVIAASSAC